MCTKVNGILYGPVKITASVVIEKKLYFGQLPVVQIKGFKDEILGSFSTNSLTTADLDASEVERSWQRISSVKELAVTPALILRANDHYPLLKETETSA